MSRRSRHVACIRRIMRIVAVIALGLLLAGCSAIRIAYNQAGHVATWKADDYFGLSDEQKRNFRSLFARGHAWHRATQLEAYAEQLEALERRLARGPGEQDVAWAAAGVRAHVRQLVLHTYRDAAAFLATLSDEQIAKARREFEDDNRKFAREHGVGAPGAEQRRLRAKNHLERIEHWTGPLDWDQRARVTTLSEALPLDASLRHQDRLRRQREFLHLLAARRDPGFAERLRAWLLDWNAGRPAEVQARMAEYEQAHYTMLLTVFGELRPDQQRRVGERVRFYVDAMRELARPSRHAAAEDLPGKPWIPADRPGTRLALAGRRNRT